MKLCLLLALALTAAAEEDIEFFEKRVRPLLAAKCYPCHSARTMAQKGLRLDTREAVRKGGSRGPAVTPRRADVSVLARAVSYQDPDLRMPPTGKLSEQEIADLRAWIEMGAPDPREEAAAKPSAGLDLEKARQWWAFQPFLAHSLPPVADKRWPTTWIDHFILAGLEAKKLRPAPAADKRTLIRRVSFDLTGLPPAPEEIDAFLTDNSPNAYQKLVDRLLGSPHYGERWARHWLDLARYAETDGHEFDREKPNAWRYRDYVIRAFNEDVPFDQFVREQIAGDLIARPRQAASAGHWDSPVGTGFFGLGEERNAADDLAEVRAEKLENQIDGLTKTFLGLTVACARCHDHKFDPIPTRDYYALAGILDSKRLIQACLDTPERTRETERVHGEIEQVNRQIADLVASRRSDLARDLVLAAEEKEGGTPLAKAWAAELKQAAKEPDHPLYALAKLAQGASSFSERLAALRKELAEWGAKTDADAVVIADFSTGNQDGWRVDGPAFGKAPQANGFYRVNELTGLLTSKSFRAEKAYLHVRLAGNSDTTSARQPGLLRVSLVGDGRDVTVTPDGTGRFVWRTTGLGKSQNEIVFVEIADRTRSGSLAVDKIALSDSREPPAGLRRPHPRVLEMLEAPLGSWEELAAAYQRWIKQEDSPLIQWLPALSLEQIAGEWPELRASEAKRESLASSLPDPVYGMVTVEDVPHDIRLHVGGNHKNLGDEVPRRFLSVLSGGGEPYRQGSGRVALAEAIASRSNPLAARVIVNRVWQHHFGQGLVRTPDNFGRMGMPPSNRELLDTLAARFVESGWSLKKLHRVIVLSSAYRMSASSDASAARVDPENRLLHHMPVRRLEAEAIRDAILAVTGSLDRTVYGPPVPPYISEYQDGRGKPQTGPLDGAGRRSVYVGVRRNFLPPMFVAFDYPMTVTTVGRRGTSTVPSQALILMNNEFVATQSARWADRLQSVSDGRRRVGKMFLTAFGRPAEEAEIGKSLRFVADQKARYGQAPDAEFRAWSDLGHVLMNSKEFIFIR